MFTTGARPQSAPTVMKDIRDATKAAKGFIITSAGIAFGGGGGGTSAYIIDADGDVVWWAAAPANCSRALMSYEGTDMWMLELNVENAGGEMRRVSMDGMDVEMNVQGLSKTHHDFTVLPGGIVAAPSWASTGMDPPSDLIERSPDGMIKTVVRIDQQIYQSNTYHTNAIVYYPDDDTYTLGDRNPNAYVKISRAGDVLWQFGGSCSNAPAPKCASGSWQVNHGHQLLPNGNFVFFNNGQGASGSTAYEYSLTESGNSLTASMVWSFNAQGVSSMVLGDVQRLPNGNTIVIYSNAGDIYEVDQQKAVVQITSAGAFGYANYRDTLYGPPLR
ncbi:MAG TPA: aryl-sulfate sulfotransferase [Polyangiaceae bacterium]